MLKLYRLNAGQPNFLLKCLTRLPIWKNIPVIFKKMFKMVKQDNKLWTVEIPDKYKVGHEAHFGQVTEKYLQYLIDGKLPKWEVPNMIVKYYTTTEGLKKAMEE